MTAKFRYWILPLLLSVFVSINFFWVKPMVPGFDSPFYLSEIRNFQRTLPAPWEYLYPDRYLTIAFPSLISILFRFDPVVSYRVSITFLYLIISLVLYRLLYNLAKRSLYAAVLSSSLVVSPFLLSYSTMLFANFTGLLVIFAFFAVETEPAFKYKNLVLAFIFSLIFLVHNFSTITFSLITTSYFLLKHIFSPNFKFSKSSSLILLMAITFALIGLSQAARLAEILRLSQPAVIGDETARIINSTKDYMGKYWLYFFPVFIFVAAAATRREIIPNRKQFILPLAILLPSVLLAFQPLYGVNFLPERFVSLACLSTYFVYFSFITLPRFKKFSLPLAVLPLLLNYISADSLILDKGYRNITPSEIRTYQEIQPLLDHDGFVLISSDHYYWSRYLLDGFQVFSGDHFVACGQITSPGYFGDTSFIFARLLGESDAVSGSRLLSQLKSLHPKTPLFILSDSNLSCAHGKVLQQLDGVRQLYHRGNWRLYEII